MISTQEKIKQAYINEVPESLIKEVMDGQPIYYQGFQAVLDGSQKLEDIMGVSGLQMIILGFLTRFLNRNLSDDYEVFTGEVGLHLGTGNNLAADLVIYNTNDINNNTIDRHYLSIPPKVVVEIDVEDLTYPPTSPNSYFTKKTAKLLDFGVEKVIWYFADAKMTAIATAENPKRWIIIDWNEPIEILGQHFSIGETLEKRGITV